MIILILHQIKLYIKQIYYSLIVILFLILSIVLYSLYYTDSVTGVYYSAMSPPATYMIVVLGGYPLLLMCCFLCFLGRNLLTRDEFYRIQEVVITRPISNFRLLVSQTIALVIVGWIPLFVFVAFVQLSAYLHNFVDVDFAVHFEVVAATKFLFITCPVTLCFVAVLALLFNLLFRNNLLTLTALLATVIAGAFLLTKVSHSQYVFFEGLPLIGSIGSAMDPSVMEFSDLVRYLVFWLVVVFLFFVGVVLYQRRDVFTTRNIFGGAIAGGLLVLCVSSTLSTAFAREVKLQHWADAFHGRVHGMAPEVDVQNLTGTVVLNPAHNLIVEIELGVRVLSETLQDEIVLWLNPGFVVNEAKIDGNGVSFELDSIGALRLELVKSLQIDQEISLSLSYEGKPDLDFGYFDSSTDVSTMPMWDQLLSYMGTEHGIFSQNFVALPSEVNWLPTAFLPLHKNRTYKDFFNSQILLTLPSDWEAALPGRKLTEEDRTRGEFTKSYEFSSQFPISSMNLLAGPLVSKSRNIDGITFEVLISDQQLAKQTLLSEYVETLADTLAEQLDANKLEGFELPCSTYRFIAVPHHLRAYGGGTFLNLVLSDKCSYLLREFDFFAVNWQRSLPDQIDQFGIARETYLVTVLKNYFRFGFQGTNFELDLFNSYWDHEVGIVGEEAEVLNLILSYLNDLRWYANMDGFSASGFFPEAMGRGKYTTQLSYLMYGGRFHLALARHHLNRVVKPMIRHVSLVENIVGQDLYNEEIQRVALSTSIQQTLATDLNPFLVETLRARCAHLSYQLFQVLEEENVKLLFDELLTRYRHSNITLEDVYQTGIDLDLPVVEVLGDWFTENKQPRYAFSTARSYKLEASDAGENTFQTLFHVRNEGDGIGVFSTSVTTQRLGLGAVGYLAGDFAAQPSNIRFGASGMGPVVYLEPGQATEIGIVSEHEPIRALVQPLNLSLGGGRVAISTKLMEDTRTFDPDQLEEFHGFRPSEWIPQPIPNDIVVDDLDPSFSVENNKDVSDVKTWRRINYPSAWGNTRRTMVYCESKNPKRIQFQADLPSAGMWGLEFHLPDLRGQFGDYQAGFLPRGRISMGGGNLFFWQSVAGEYTFTLDSGAFSQELQVSIRDSDYGWIRVTEAQLEPGTTIVGVKPLKSNGKLFGDAIRWIPIDAGE